MDFSLTDIERSWRAKAQALARALPGDASADQVVSRAAAEGLVDAGAGLLAAAVAVEALACESAAAALAFALHSGVILGIAETANHNEPLLAGVMRGETSGAIALAAEDVPVETDGRLNGRASWVAPVSERGVALVGAQRSPGGPATAVPAAHAVCLVALDAPGIAVERIGTTALRGVVCGHVSFSDVPCAIVGDTPSVMARVRILLAALGLGMGRRALQESLAVARAFNRTGAGGEQTVQGLLADTATEIDAAKLLTWKAASGARLSLAEASMAKLAATEATQRAVARATQVIGSASFKDGHVIARLAQDVRALELFAGRTESLREAVAFETLPRST